MKKDRMKWYFLMAGMLPDILGFGGLNNWMWYHWSHSIVMAIVFTALFSYLWTWTIAIPYWLHIVVDVFTHKSGTFNLFFPFTDPIAYKGMSWWEEGIYIEITGAIILAIILIFRIIQSRTTEGNR